MGLTIHYNGSLKRATDLKLLIEEVKDTAKVNRWDYLVFEDTFENNLFSKIIDNKKIFGIKVTPKNCEPFCFTFLSNGKMSGVINFKIMQMDPNIKEDLIYAVSTKTQYSGYDTHKKLILLLDHISAKYLTEFECIDEGEYWETRDEEVLIEKFNRHTSLIDNFDSATEMIPQKKGENTVDYLIRMAEITTKNNDIKVEKDKENELPKLSIEQENEFKRMKLSLEHDAIFPDNLNSNIPPEIVSQFLDNIKNFENMYENEKQISVFDKIGKPEFVIAELLNEEELNIELERLETLLNNHNLTLDVICDYENEERLIYTFITEELFKHEIDDLNLPGMVTHFTYEEFHPNDEYDIEFVCTDFIEMFLNTKDKMYLEYHSKDALNYVALNNFRNLFKKFKIKYYKFETIKIEEHKAKATFNIDFWGKIKGTETKIYYSGDGEITFKHEYGYWYIQDVTLPVMD